MVIVESFSNLMNKNFYFIEFGSNSSKRKVRTRSKVKIFKKTKWTLERELYAGFSGMIKKLI